LCRACRGGVVVVMGTMQVRRRASGGPGLFMLGGGMDEAGRRRMAQKFKEASDARDGMDTSRAYGSPGLSLGMDVHECCITHTQ